MARIPEEEIERLKREVSVERLAEARGVKLRRSGKNLIGLCPFHEDTNPSLSIDPVQNIWNCQGACRKGGSVIDWVMHAEGVSFRHAVELLRADKSARVKGIRHTRDKVTKTKTEIRSRWGGGSWQVPGFFHLGGRPFAAYIDQAYSIHVNALGTTTMDANASGTVVGDLSLYPWGQFWLGSSPEWHYAGFEYGDSGTGFYPTANRQYSPTPSRWMSPDPMGGKLADPQTLNKYVYVRDNPLRFTDPTGLDLKEQCAQESATCHKQHWFSRHRYVGTYNQQNHFDITHFQTDQSGNLSGHTVDFNSSGPHIDGNRAEFIAGTPATRVNGAGAFDGMHAVFNSNCGGTCAAGGLLFGTQAQFQNLVKNLVGPNPGLDAIDFFHPGTIQFRGGNTNGPDAHLSFNESNDPYQQDPFHFDNRYPYGSASGFLEHTGGVIQTFWNSLTGQHGPPLPQDITPSVSVPQ